MISISSNFDSGNIEVLEVTEDRARLNIRKDAGGDHYQWFHFRVAGKKAELVIENASGASYSAGFEGYAACASTDQEHWVRVPTRYENGKLIITHDPEGITSLTQKRASNVIWYAYFAPYSYARHESLIAQAAVRPGVELWEAGKSLDGRPLDVLSLGEGEKPVWIIARQHPGESMAEWFMEGLIERLTDESDALARLLRKQLRFHLVPNMNPDGSVRGHLRNNAAGANLNREWAEPTLERSPEVFFVRHAMDEKGLALCLDVHGDETLPYNFIAGPDGVEGLSESVLSQIAAYETALARACPDFQMEHGYPKAPLGHANMAMATNQLASRFDAPCMTLEQPFKDNADAPMANVGWSPERAKRLGAAQLDAIFAIV